MAGSEKYYYAKEGVIPRLREAKGWGQELLAKNAVISWKTLNSVEQGNSAQLRTFRKIANALEVEPAILIQGMDAKQDLEPSPSAGIQNSVEVTLKFMLNFANFDETSDLVDILNFIRERIHPRGEMIVKNVRGGSVLIDLIFTDRSDVDSLVREFCQLAFLDTPLHSMAIHAPLDLVRLIAQSAHNDLFYESSFSRETFENVLRQRTEETHMFAVRGRIGSYFIIQPYKSGWLLMITRPTFEHSPTRTE